MMKISTYQDLFEYCRSMNPKERAMAVQVGSADGLTRVHSIGHTLDAPDAGHDTMILETA